MAVPHKPRRRREDFWGDGQVIRTGQMQRQRKQLRATEKGQALIALVAEPLRSPQLTAAWEPQLKEVEGKRPAEAFKLKLELAFADKPRQVMVPDRAGVAAAQRPPATPVEACPAPQPLACPKCGYGRIIVSEGRSR